MRRRTLWVAAVVLVVGTLALTAPLGAASHRVFDRDGFIDARDFRHRSLFDDRYFGRGSLLDDSFFGYRSSRTLTNLLVLDALGVDRSDALACAYGSHYVARYACSRALLSSGCTDPLTASLLLGHGRLRERELVLLLAAQNRAC